MSQYDEQKKVIEAIPNFDKERQKIRQFLKDKKGFSSSDLDKVQTAEQVISYHQEMMQDQQQRSKRIREGAQKYKQKQSINHDLIKDEKANPVKRVAEVLACAGITSNKNHPK